MQKSIKVLYFYFLKTKDVHKHVLIVLKFTCLELQKYMDELLR